jgi:hypothetical protein
MIHKQFLSRDGNATILPPLHCHRQKSIARVSVALKTVFVSVCSTHMTNRVDKSVGVA